jgi:two-component SAPR family response regulator
MNVLIVDPDQTERKTLCEFLTDIYHLEDIQSFTDPLMAIKYSANTTVDVLYTVTTMNRVNGFELGKILRNFNPDIRLNFIADVEQERTDAMRLMAERCILRPVTSESLSPAEQDDW